MDTQDKKDSIANVGTTATTAPVGSNAPVAAKISASEDSSTRPEAARNETTTTPSADRAAPARDNFNRGRPGRNNFSSAREIFEQELGRRAGHVDAKLRQQLVGTILFRLSAPGRSEGEQRYLVDWSGDVFKSGSSTQESADCVVQMAEQTFLKIVSGDLNPQIVMLSDKVQVSGKASLAVYFFNLVTMG